MDHDQRPTDRQGGRFALLTAHRSFADLIVRFLPDVTCTALQRGEIVQNHMHAELCVEF